MTVDKNKELAVPNRRLWSGDWEQQSIAIDAQRQSQVWEMCCQLLREALKDFCLHHYFASFSKWLKICFWLLEKKNIKGWVVGWVVFISSECEMLRLTVLSLCDLELLSWVWAVASAPQQAEGAEAECLESLLCTWIWGGWHKNASNENRTRVRPN